MPNNPLAGGLHSFDVETVFTYLDNSLVQGDTSVGMNEGETRRFPILFGPSGSAVVIGGSQFQAEIVSKGNQGMKDFVISLQPGCNDEDGQNTNNSDGAQSNYAPREDAGDDSPGDPHEEDGGAEQQRDAPCHAESGRYNSRLGLSAQFRSEQASTTRNNAVNAVSHL